jgi:hypothetical protein
MYMNAEAFTRSVFSSRMFFEPSSKAVTLSGS